MSRPTDPKFKAMKVVQKIVFVCKVVIFFCSFGFAFPNILVD